MGEMKPVSAPLESAVHLASQRPKECRCGNCLFTRKVQRVQAKLSAHDRSTIEKLLHKWAHEATDAAYYRAKLAGTWPK